MPPYSRARGPPRMVMTHRNFFVGLFIIIGIGLLITTILQFYPHQVHSDDDFNMVFRVVQPTVEVIVSRDSPKPARGDKKCSFHTCFDVYRCGYNDDNRISVYIYPPAKFLDEDGLPLMLPVSKEFSEIVQSISNSLYYEPDPDKACLFLPPVDVLNQNSIRLEETAQILASLSRWNDGINHLLFNMLPGSSPDFNTALDVNYDKAILGGGGFSTWTYRRSYDVAVPVYNPLTAGIHFPPKPDTESRPLLLISSQIGLHPEYKEELHNLVDHYPSKIRILDKCNDDVFNFTRRCGGGGEVYHYPSVLREATFCLVIRGSRLGTPTLSDVMKAGCIPVVVADTYVLPFSEVLDWKRAAIEIYEEDLDTVMDVIQAVSEERVVAMRKQVRFYWENYIGTIRSIVMTTLQIINDRVFPYAARKYEEWNNPLNKAAIQSPLFLPLIPPKMSGFTAVILTYDRQESLFQVIEQVALAPSLAKVLVVWNNQQKPPPPASEWPVINKPLKVVQTRHNRLSNRFYPYDEVETEAILALDDDILMLTTDELEFGFEVWRQFSDRLVGFPSRLHLWDNTTTHWKYESEWTSAISMVLTGAAFYHKYYSYLYTNSMPGNIKAWVDEHMNCEDIAMNFLIANTTGKAPIKVAPRQKFKCPGCVNQAMLSADLSHMVERSECLNTFAENYGTLPLKTVEFRADPVLYKQNAEFNWFKDIGSL